MVNYLKKLKDKQKVYHNPVLPSSIKHLNFTHQQHKIKKNQSHNHNYKNIALENNIDNIYSNSSLIPPSFQTGGRIQSIKPDLQTLPEIYHTQTDSLQNQSRDLSLEDTVFSNMKSINSFHTPNKINSISTNSTTAKTMLLSQEIQYALPLSNAINTHYTQENLMESHTSLSSQNFKLSLDSPIADDTTQHVPMTNPTINYTLQEIYDYVEKRIIEELTV